MGRRSTGSPLSSRQGCANAVSARPRRRAGRLLGAARFTVLGPAFAELDRSWVRDVDWSPITQSHPLDANCARYG